MSCIGVILAGGSGSRLYPLTAVTNKHLLPVFDKPMIYYPLTTLMLAGIREIVIVSSPADVPRFEQLLCDGAQWGMKISYRVQDNPDGLPQAFTLAADLIPGRRVCLILGDNIFFGQGLPALLQRAAEQKRGAHIFSQIVRDPERFGVVSYGKDGGVGGFVEKPKVPPSNQAVTGLYFYDDRVVEIARRLKRSARGEYEITDVNNAYLELGELELTEFGRGMTWLDAGTPEALATASQYIRVIEDLQNTRVACPEEVALRMGFIDKAQLIELIRPYVNSPYGQYLTRLADERSFGSHLAIRY